MFGHAGEDMGFDASGFADSGFEDIFNMFTQGGRAGGFGSGFGSTAAQNTRQTRGSDLEASLHLTFMEAVNGCHKIMEVNTYDPCNTCSGSGNKPDSKVTICKSCNGQGVQILQQGPFAIQMTCSTCGGQGKSQPKCTSCHGKGVQRAKKQINVEIPAGVDNDVRVRLMNQGDAGQCNGPRGHLHVRLKVDKHNIFKRDKTDIHCDVDISLYTALLGGHVVVPTLNGQTKIKIEPGTQPYEQRILRNKGIKQLHGNTFGNQYIHFKIKLPTNLNDKAIELVKQLGIETGDIKQEQQTQSEQQTKQHNNDNNQQTTQQQHSNAATEQAQNGTASSEHNNSANTTATATTTDNNTTTDRQQTITKSTKNKKSRSIFEKMFGSNKDSNDDNNQQTTDEQKIKQN